MALPNSQGEEPVIDSGLTAVKDESALWPNGSVVVERERELSRRIVKKMRVTSVEYLSRSIQINHQLQVTILCFIQQ